MSMIKKLLCVQLPAQTITILEILCQRTGRNQDDLTQEALSFIFDEYKEVIFDSLIKNDLKNQIDLDKVPRINISLDSYQGKKQLENITELELIQINFARQVIIQDESHYSQVLKDGGYLFDDLSKWQVFNVDKTELGITRVVLWNERDDGSFSVHFTENSTEAAFYCFEN
jgi:hypothetical protein